MGLGGEMKKILGILMVVCICIALGISVGWFRERDVSMVLGRADCGCRGTAVSEGTLQSLGMHPYTKRGR